MSEILNNEKLNDIYKIELRIKSHVEILDITKNEIQKN